MPSEFNGTCLDPARLNGLESEVHRLFELLDLAAPRVPKFTSEHAEFAKRAAQVIEPFVAKVLARCGDARPTLAQAVQERPDLKRLLKQLNHVSRSPFDPQLLSMGEKFTDASGWEAWPCQSVCLWRAFAARMSASHGAPEITTLEGLEILWSTGVVLLSITEMSIDLFDVAGGRLPPRFRPVRSLGAGGMGEVFLAVDEVTESNRAVKVLRIADESSREAREALVREAKALEKLNCKRVVRYHDVVEVAGGVAVVMAYVEGETLQQEIDKTGPLSVADAVNATIDVLSALEEIHSVGLVHRDVKPSNFIRTSTCIVAIDFGLARPIGSDLTQPGRAGSDRFVAPEQLEGKADSRSDLYAAGRLLYSLIAGKPPVHDLDALTRASPEVPAALATAYLKATARQPANRFQSADEMRRALQGENAVASAPVDSLDPGRRWGAYQVERTENKSEGRWTLVHARRRDGVAARARLLWVHHATLETSESERRLVPVVGLRDLSSPLIQTVEEIVDRPSFAIAFGPLPTTSMADVMKRSGSSGRRMSPPTAVRLARDVALGLSEVHLGLAPGGHDGATRPGASESPGRELLRAFPIWPRVVRISGQANITLSLFTLLRDGWFGGPVAQHPALRYRAPELFPGLERGTAIDLERAHIYSVAVMLWECLVGSQAFGAATLDELRAQVQRGRLQPVAQREAILPPAIERLLGQALSVEPEERPVTLAAFAEGLGGLHVQPHECMRELASLVGDTLGPGGDGA